VSDEVSQLVPATVDELVLEAPPADARNARLVTAFIGGQTSIKSRQTALDSLRRIARAMGRVVGLGAEDERSRSPETIQWCSMGYEQAIAIRACLAEMCANGEIAPVTANLTLSHLRSLIATAGSMGLITPQQAMLSSPKFLKNVPGKRVSRGRALTIAEEKALREATVFLESYQPTMLDAAIVLAVGGGLRREEVARVKVDGVGLTELRVIGKGNKERRTDVDDDMRAALDEWLAIRSHLSPLHDFLFCSPERADHPLSGWSFWRLVRCVSHRAFGDGDPCSKGCHCMSVVTGPHDFRRTFASRLLEQGFDLSEVQKLMDHESIQTTALYDKRELEALHEKRRRTRILA
jgi:site-specific recombinase XerD